MKPIPDTSLGDDIRVAVEAAAGALKMLERLRDRVDAIEEEWGTTPIHVDDLSKAAAIMMKLLIKRDVLSEEQLETVLYSGRPPPSSVKQRIWQIVAEIKQWLKNHNLSHEMKSVRGSPLTGKATWRLTRAGKAGVLAIIERTKL